MIDAAEVRAKPGTFDHRLRGYAKNDVAAYLGRLALAFDVLGDASYVPELPSDFTPGAIRTHAFAVVWRGLDTEQVRAYLAQLGDDLEALLAAPPRPAELHLPPNFVEGSSVTAGGVLTGSQIQVRGQRRSVNFATPEGLTSDLATRLEHADTCLVDTTIVVPELTDETMRCAVTQLDYRGDL